VVYLVFSHVTKSVYALKTLLVEYLEEVVTRERFLREAQVWVDLERHPYLVRAYFVDEIAARLYIAMEYIAPDQQGLNSLDGYLKRQPPDLPQSLRWAIQFCHGMEYAYSRGIRSHRDIKPTNILIEHEKSVKISDFGLAGIFQASRTISRINQTAEHVKLGLPGQTIEEVTLGTPTHMPPEQFTNAAECDERSDLYSFGVVLYEMASSGKLPFFVPRPMTSSEQEASRFWSEMYSLHSKCPAPRLNSPLFPIIQRCLEKEPNNRFQTFKELRKELEPVLKRLTGEVINPPALKELEAWEWSNKGTSLGRLGRFEEALLCLDKALELDSKYSAAWINKGHSLNNLSRFEEALQCLDNALELDPNNAPVWINKGYSLNNLGRFEEAVLCLDKALELDRSNASASINKAVSLNNLGCFEEALRCFDKVLELDPSNALALINKGVSLNNLGCFEEALRCLDRALELDPSAAAWLNKGVSLNNLGRFEEALRCFDQGLELEPNNVAAWINKGVSLNNLNRFEEAVGCCEQALAFEQRSAHAWFTKGYAEEQLGRSAKAARCYQEFLRLSPTRDTNRIEYARQQLRKLEGK
jgi:tetratricopeptide (TPR) repeat protein